jgi:hypothetical protein
MHNLLLSYWLAAGAIAPDFDAGLLTVIVQVNLGTIAPQ